MSERRLEGARPLRLTGVGVFGCMAILAAAVAQAAIPTDWDGCNKGYPPETKIAACTKIINNQSETTPDRIKALVLRAWGHNFKNEYDAAYDDIGEAIKLDPNKVDSYDARASMMASAGEVDRPIVDYTAAINLQPEGYRYLQRGDLYRKRHDFEHAIADYKAAAAQFTEKIAAHPDASWAYISRSHAYRDLGDVDDALNDFNAFLKYKKDADDPQLADRGDLYLRKGDFDDAIADYTAVIDKKPDEFYLYEKRALAYRLKGDYKRAILDYDTMIKTVDNNPEVLIGRGLAYAGAGEPERAAVDFTKAIDVYPEGATAYYDRAQAERESGNPDIAIADYSAAIERDPNYAVAFNSRGRAYVALHDDAHAMADFNEAIRLNDKLGAAYYNRASLHQAAGRLDQAIADFGRALATDPSNKDFLVARGSALATNTSYAAAEKDFSAALKIDPLDTAAYIGRAATRLKLGATAESLDDVNRALLLDGSLASAYTVRADIYAAQGKADKAAADRLAADNVRTAAEKSRQAAEAARAHPHVKVIINGVFFTSPPYLKRTFTFGSTIEVRDDQITYTSPGLSPYKVASGDKIQENFPGTCNNRPVPDQGTRSMIAIFNKYLIQVELESRIDFHTQPCGGRYNYYKENFVIDLSNGGCKFSYKQDRDLFGVGAFDNKVYDQTCVAETLR
jgi:tetratricopeptide (TPR) repeat protein